MEPPHVQVVRGEGAFLRHGSGVAGASLGLTAALVVHPRTGEVGGPFSLATTVEPIGRRAELRDLRGSVSAGGTGVGGGGGGVFGAAVLRAGLVQALGGVFWGTHHEVSCAATLGQPGPSATALRAESLHLHRLLTFGKSKEEIGQVSQYMNPQAPQK